MSRDSHLWPAGAPGLTSEQLTDQALDAMLATQPAPRVRVSEPAPAPAPAPATRTPGPKVPARPAISAMQLFTGPDDFLRAVHAADLKGQRFDPRLIPYLAAGGDEHHGLADPSGGFLIPEGVLPGLLPGRIEDDPLAERVTHVPMATRKLSIPARVDTDHSTSYTGGMLVKRRAQTQTVDFSRSELESVTLQAVGLFGFTVASEELIHASAVSIPAILEAAFRDEMSQRFIHERLHGTGVGQFLGVLQSPALITVDAEESQDAGTITLANLISMRRRCWRFSSPSTCWLAHESCLDSLLTLNQSMANPGVFAFAGGGGLDRLLGAPIFFTEHCLPVGSVGDIVLCNWSQYLEGTLFPLRGLLSLHVRFIQNEGVFKFWVENDGRPWWRSPLTPKNGDPVSPFVALAAREEEE